MTETEVVSCDVPGPADKQPFESTGRHITFEQGIVHRCRMAAAGLVTYHHLFRGFLPCLKWRGLQLCARWAALSGQLLP